MNRGFVILILCECIAGVATLGYVFERRLATGDEYDRQVNLAMEAGKRIREQTILPHNERVSAGENFKSALQKFGLSAEEAASASAAAQRAFNLRQLRAGNTITVGRSVEGELREIDYKIDTDRMLKIIPEEGGFTARISEIPSKTEIVAVTGWVDDSLFNAVEDAGIPGRETHFASCWKRKSTRTGKRPGTEKFLRQSTRMRDGNIRRCCFTIPRGGWDITRRTESLCRKHFCARR